MQTEDDSAMIDEQWRGYDLRAAVPMFALAALLTAALLASRIFFNDFIDALIAYLLVLVLWPALLCVAVYRAVTFTYRVTDRALLVDRGFLSRPEPPLPYRELTGVESGGNLFHSWLGIGWVHVTATGGRTVKLPAIRDPAAFAKRLRERMRLSK